MITPEKHLDLNNSVLRVAALLLRLLRRKRVITMDEGIASVERKLGKQTTLVFTPALNLLFLLGKVEYFSPTDTLEYLGR